MSQLNGTGHQVWVGREVHLLLADGLHARALVTRIVDVDRGVVDLRLVERPDGPRWVRPVRTEVPRADRLGTWHVPDGVCGRAS